MICTEEITTAENQNPYGVDIVKHKESRRITPSKPPGVVHALRPHELNVTGSQLLVGFTSAFTAVGLLLWACLKLWLFEP